MAYRQSFYQFLMTLRDPDSNGDLAQFANNAQFDSTFPRQEQDRTRPGCQNIWRKMPPTYPA